MYDLARCWECYYATHDAGIAICEYILIEGRRRDCYDGRTCDKWRPREGKRQVAITFEKGFEVYEREQEHFGR